MTPNTNITANTLERILQEQKSIHKLLEDIKDIDKKIREIYNFIVILKEERKTLNEKSYFAQIIDFSWEYVRMMVPIVIFSGITTIVISSIFKVSQDIFKNSYR